MPMKKIYLVYSCSGEWEDYNEYLRGTFTNFEQAKLFGKDCKRKERDCWGDTVDIKIVEAGINVSTQKCPEVWYSLNGNKWEHTKF